MILKLKNHFKVDFFNKVNVTLRYDTIASTFSFEHFFNPDDINHRELWEPGHFHKVSIEHNNELLITGFILNQSFGSSSLKKLSNIQGYSLPGVLEDCQIPTDIYPLQSDNLTLREITNKILAYFTSKQAPIKLVVDPSVSSKVNSVFEKTTANESDSVKSYLTKLAAQKNIVLSHTPEGNLLYTKASTKQKPIFHFEKGVVGVTDISLSFSGQRMHSSITLIKQASVDGGNAGQNTIANPFVKFARRPAVKVQTSGTDNDTKDAARQALSMELKGIVLTIELNSWLIDGKIIRPNQVVTVTDRESFIFKPTKFFIEAVNLKGDETSETATLTCVLPEVYNSAPVTNIFAL